MTISSLIFIIFTVAIFLLVLAITLKKPAFCYHLFSKHRRITSAIIIVGLVICVAGTIISNLHRPTSLYENAITSISMMSESGEIIIASDENDYAELLNLANNYQIKKPSDFTTPPEKFWYFLRPDNPNFSKSLDELFPEHHVVSEIIADDYSVYELEKHWT